MMLTQDQLELIDTFLAEHHMTDQRELVLQLCEDAPAVTVLHLIQHAYNVGSLNGIAAAVEAHNKTIITIIGGEDATGQTGTQKLYGDETFHS